ncbi:PIN domain-containing protein [Alloactinosynnema sp. L-07]|uniref:PIN domain-containing protein n=1 Tax=Alloactinosynnema sp. L-07 TaxID=1653480 RepID=UPI0012F81011|nr:PIN domain-containing protein [Alloactinosynnema sp. L-07]
MLITPNPGRTLPDALEVLRQLRDGVYNLHSGGGVGPGSSAGKMWAYLEWIRKAERQLANVIFREDAAALLDWKGYEALMAMAPAWAAAVGGNAQERILHDVVGDEITERHDTFGAACAAVEVLISQWSDGMPIAVLDTSVYLAYQDKLEAIDWVAAMGAKLPRLRLVVPMIVVDELDGTKHSDVRWRAAYSLATIDRVIRSGGVLSETPRVEIVLFNDPVGHTRMAIADQEIIDRAAAVQAIAGTPVTLLTCDTGMALRALDADLGHMLLPREDQPKRRT